MVTLVRRPGSERVLAGVCVLSLILGLLIVAYQTNGIKLPEWVYFGLLGLGTIGGATINGYRDGGVVVSCIAAGIGVVPMALAFAPSGPPEIHLSLFDILLKTAGPTLFVGVAVGGLSHGAGLTARRLQAD